MMRALLTALLILVPTAAFAHTGHGDTSGFFHGFAHPIGGLDHVLTMVAVGVFAATLGGRALWLVPLSFVGVMVAGFALGATGVGLPFVEQGILLSTVVIAAAAIFARRVPVHFAAALVGLFAVFHGHAHVAEMPATVSGLEFALGFVAATVLLHLTGIAGTIAASRLAGRLRRTIAR